MVAAAKFQDFVEQLVKGVHAFGTHTFKLYLSNEAPLATDTVKTDIAELGGGNGYTAGGADVGAAASETGGTATVQGDQIVWTASGGTIGPFRYAVLYNDSATSPLDALVLSWDYGSSITLNPGETFTVTFNSTDPGDVFTLA